MCPNARTPASPARVVFLDDGGVLNDNDRRAVEWRRLLGEFFAPRLGGTPDAWGEANRSVFLAIWDDWRRLRQRGEEPGPSWWPDQDERWLGEMCERVGVPVPTDVPATVKASRAFVMAHIDCAYPDAAPAMRAMHAMGIRLHLASGGQTYELEPYLQRMGVWELIDRPYGVDLLGVNKLSRRYYERIVEDSGVDPRSAVVVDSDAAPLEWADAVGFRTVHVDRLGQGSRFTRIASLAELVPLLAEQR
ncbi:MAG TPA: HAD family hydrolase [Candidatus Limnocylindria bacterium]